MPAPEPNASPPRDVLICATQRSGSNLLASLLLQTWQVGWPGEWLVPPTELGQRQLYRVPESAGLEDYIQVLRERRGSPNGGFSIKLMWDNVIASCHRLRREQNAPDAAQEELEAHLLHHTFRNPLCVHLRRRDCLGQAISLVKAQQTGIWRQFESRAYDPASVSFQYEAIQRALEEIAFENNAWDAFFARHGLEPLRVEYEAFSADPAEVVAAIVRSAGVADPRLHKLNLNRGVKKQRDDLNRLWRDAFEQRSRWIETRDPEYCEAGPADAAAFAVETTPAEPMLELEPAQTRCVRVHVANRSNHVWKPVGGAGDAWMPHVRVRWIRLPEELLREDQRALLPDLLPPGRSAAVEAHVTAPAEPGDYWLEFDFRQEGNRGASERGVPPTHVFVRVAPVDETFRAADHFACPPPEAPSELMRCGWFDDFNGRHFPWIHHRQHEWLFCSGTGARDDDFWFFYPRLGLIWTSSRLWPRFFSVALDAWIRFQPDESAQHRIFFNEKTQTRFEIPIYGEPQPIAHPPDHNWIR